MKEQKLKLKPNVTVSLVQYGLCHLINITQQMQGCYNHWTPKTFGVKCTRLWFVTDSQRNTNKVIEKHRVSIV